MIQNISLGAISLKCDYVNKFQGTKSAVIAIPGRNADVIQHLGKSSKLVELRGIINGGSMESDKTTLEGYIGTTQTYTDDDESFTMYVEAVNIPVIGGQPNHYTFVIRGYKYE